MWLLMLSARPFAVGGQLDQRCTTRLNSRCAEGRAGRVFVHLLHIAFLPQVHHTVNAVDQRHDSALGASYPMLLLLR